MRVLPFERVHLPQLLELVNIHLAAVVPGLTITGEFLAATLERNFTEYITGPWVAERATLCAVEGYRVLAAAHLLSYGTGPEVNASYKGTAEVDWFLALPGRDDAASATLSTARDLLSSWGAEQKRGWGGGLPAGPPLWGVPDAWPHVAAALDDAGFDRPARPCREALYGGALDSVPEAGEPPFAALEMRRTAGADGTRFAAFLEGQELGFCEVDQTPTHGWADLREMHVREEWRNRGIGGWLLQHAIRWLRLSGRNRIVINVTEEAEAAGAARFYQRFGWQVLARGI